MQHANKAQGVYCCFLVTHVQKLHTAHGGGRYCGLPFVMIALVWAGTLNCGVPEEKQRSGLSVADDQRGKLCSAPGSCKGQHLTSSAANLSTAVNGASSGTLKLRIMRKKCVISYKQRSESHPRLATDKASRQVVCCSSQATYTLYGSLGSEVSVILKVTFDLYKWQHAYLILWSSDKQKVSAQTGEAKQTEKLATYILKT